MGVALVIAVDGVGAVDSLPEIRHRGIDVAAPVVSVLELHIRVADLECSALTQILTDTEAEEMAAVVGYADTIVVLALSRLIEGIAAAQLGAG